MYEYKYDFTNICDAHASLLIYSYFFTLQPVKLVTGSVPPPASVFLRLNVASSRSPSTPITHRVTPITALITISFEAFIVTVLSTDTIQLAT